MRKLSFALVLAFLLIPASQLFAQAGNTNSASFAFRYDLDRPDANLNYCRVVGRLGSPNFNDPILGTARIKTTGSSVTVVAVTAGQNPFANVGIDDTIIVRRPNGTVERRTVSTRTDADNITVDLAVNWDQATGFAFSWLDTQCGQADTDGWIDTAGFQAKSVTFLLEQLNGTVGGIDWRIECIGNALGSLPNPVHPGAAGSCAPGTSAGGFCNFTAAGVTTGRVQIAVPADIVCPRIRLGMKIGTSDAAEAAEADKERITVTLESAVGN